MNLEELRHNELGTSFVTLASHPNSRVFLSYEQHITKAFYYTLNDIAEIENSKVSRIGVGNQTHSAISFWFLSMEAYINALLKVSCIKRGRNFSTYRGLDLSKRLSLLLDMYEISKRDFNRNGLFGKLSEFCRFRNELFHDRHFQHEIKFTKTNFSSIPFLSNQVDTFQAIKIAIEIFSALRYVICGLDTMPHVIIQNHEFSIWEKVDICYNSILKCSLESALKKHNLSTQIHLELEKTDSFESSLITETEAVCFLTVEQEESYFVPTNESNTNFVFEHYNAFLKSYNYKPMTLRFPKIMRNSNYR